MEGFRVLVVYLDEALNGRDQRTHTVMAAAFDLALRKQGEPAFHLIEPGGMGGSEMETTTFSTC